MAYSLNDVGKTCQFCHEGKLIKNPKTGKVFCEKKCWLKNDPTTPEKKFEEELNKDNEDKKWEDIGRKKTKCALAVASITAGKDLSDPEEIIKLDTWVKWVLED